MRLIFQLHLIEEILLEPVEELVGGHHIAQVDEAGAAHQGHGVLEDDLELAQVFSLGQGEDAVDLRSIGHIGPIWARLWLCRSHIVYNLAI